MTVERILWFDEQVRAGAHPGSAGLARQFGVSLRTAQRDIEVLRDRLQAPLAYDRDAKGYDYTDPSFYLPSAFFRVNEIVALLLARGLFRELVASPCREELEEISGRLEELFRAPLLKKVEEAVSFEITRGTEVRERVFFDLLRAITQRRRVHLLCVSEDGSEYAERDVLPLRLHFSLGTWYLLGSGRTGKEIRLHLLSRLRGVEVTGQTFPEGKEAAKVDAFLRRCFGLLRSGRIHDVRIRFSPGKASFASGHVWHPKQRLQFELDGSVILEIPEAEVLEIIGLVLQQGKDAVILSPKGLRDALRAEVDRLS